MDVTFKAVDLEIKYHTRQATLTAVRNVNFEIKRGQIVGLVGESGCGKSTIASAVMRLLPPNGEISNGELLFNGRDLRRLSEEQIHQMRGRDISMIFQDPMTSLNPLLPVGFQVAEVLEASPLFAGVPKRFRAWMSHGDEVRALGPGWRRAARTANCAFAAAMHEMLPFHGIQFHPEVVHTPRGQELLKRFLYDVCHARPTWTMTSIIEQQTELIRKQVGGERDGLDERDAGGHQGGERARRPLDDGGAADSAQDRRRQREAVEETPARTGPREDQ